MPTLPPELAFVLQYFIAAASHWLRMRKSASPLRDFIIACFALLLFAGLAAWLTVGFTQNPRGNILLVFGFFALVLKEGTDLLNILLDANSPFAPKPTPEPDPIALRATAQDWNNRPGDKSGN